MTMRKVRTREPDRKQGLLFMQMPWTDVPETDPVRVLARVIDKMDLTAFLAKAKSLEGTAGTANEVGRRRHPRPSARWAGSTSSP